MKEQPKQSITRAMLGRLPSYLQYVMQDENDTISSATLAKALNLGEVQVRKDLSAVSGKGKPKVGYDTRLLQKDLENMLGVHEKSFAVLVGAGKLGRALLGYEEFDSYGLEIKAAFDAKVTTKEKTESGIVIYPMEEFESYCKTHSIRVGILTVPASAAQEACNRMIACGINIIWDFAPINLVVPKNVSVRREDLALSFAYLNLLAKSKKND